MPTAKMLQTVLKLALTQKFYTIFQELLPSRQDTEKKTERIRRCLMKLFRATAAGTDKTHMTFLVIVNIVFGHN